MTQLRIKLFATTGWSLMRDSLVVFGGSGHLSCLAVDVFLDFRRSEAVFVEHARAMLESLRAVKSVVEDLKVALFVIVGQSFQGWLDGAEAQELLADDVARLNSEGRVCCTWGEVTLDTVLRSRCGQPNSSSANAWDG